MSVKKCFLVPSKYLTIHSQDFRGGLGGWNQYLNYIDTSGSESTIKKLSYGVSGSSDIYMSDFDYQIGTQSSTDTDLTVTYAGFITNDFSSADGTDTTYNNITYLGTSYLPSYVFDYKGKWRFKFTHSLISESTNFLYDISILNFNSAFFDLGINNIQYGSNKIKITKNTTVLSELYKYSAESSGSSYQYPFNNMTKDSSGNYYFTSPYCPAIGISGSLSVQYDTNSSEVYCYDNKAHLSNGDELDIYKTNDVVNLNASLVTPSKLYNINNTLYWTKNPNIRDDSFVKYEIYKNGALYATVKGDVFSYTIPMGTFVTTTNWGIKCVLANTYTPLHKINLVKKTTRSIPTRFTYTFYYYKADTSISTFDIIPFVYNLSLTNDNTLPDKLNSSWNGYSCNNFSYKIDNSEWTTYSNNNLLELPNLSLGNHTLYVTPLTSSVTPKNIDVVIDPTAAIGYWGGSCVYQSGVNSRYLISNVPGDQFGNGGSCGKVRIQAGHTYCIKGSCYLTDGTSTNKQLRIGFRSGGGSAYNINVTCQGSSRTEFENIFTATSDLIASEYNSEGLTAVACVETVNENVSRSWAISFTIFECAKATSTTYKLADPSKPAFSQSNINIANVSWANNNTQLGNDSYNFYIKQDSGNYQLSHGDGKDANATDLVFTQGGHTVTVYQEYINTNNPNASSYNSNAITSDTYTFAKLQNPIISYEDAKGTLYLIDNANNEWDYVLDQNGNKIKIADNQTIGKKIKITYKGPYYSSIQYYIKDTVGSFSADDTDSIDAPEVVVDDNNWYTDVTEVGLVNRPLALGVVGNHDISAQMIFPTDTSYNSEVITSSNAFSINTLAQPSAAWGNTISGFKFNPFPTDSRMYESLATWMPVTDFAIGIPVSDPENVYYYVDVLGTDSAGTSTGRYATVLQPEDLSKRICKWIANDPFSQEVSQDTIKVDYEAGEYIQLDDIDMPAPAAGQPSQHNTISFTAPTYNRVEFEINKIGKGTSGSICYSAGNDYYLTIDNNVALHSNTGKSGSVSRSTLADNTWGKIVVNLNTSVTTFKAASWTDSTNYWTPQHARYRYFRLYNDNILVADLVPAKRLSDNSYGYYDAISHNFYRNIGTGSFIPNHELVLNIDDPNDIGLFNYPTQVGTTNYTVRIRAAHLNSWYVGGSIPAQLSYSVIKLPTPENISYSADTHTLSWSSVTDANTYIIYQRKQDGTDEVLDSTSSTTWTHEFLDDDIHLLRVSAHKITTENQ